MSKYTFIFKRTERNKDFFKAIECTQLAIVPLGDDFYKATIFEENDAELENVIDNNFQVIDAMLEV